MTQVMQTIKDEAHRRGLTQQALADMSGVTRTTINKYFRGVQEPNLVVATMLADALGLVIVVKKGGRR